MNSLPELAALLAMLASLLLTIFIVIRNPRSGVSGAYALWGTCVTLWNLGAYFLYRVSDSESAWPWARVLHLGTVFLPATSLHLCYLVAQINRRAILVTVYSVSAAVAVTVFTPLYIQNVRRLEFGWFIIPGPMFWAFMVLYSIISTITIGTLWTKQSTLPRLHRIRLRLLIAALLILVVFGTNDLLLVMGLSFYPFTEKSIPPLGNLAAIVYAVLIAYSVLQHQLLNIHLTLSRIASNLVRMFFFVTFGAMLLMGIQVMSPQLFPASVVLACLFVLLVTGLFASVVFPRMFARGDDIIERRLLGDRFEYHDHIRVFSEALHRYPDLESISDELQNLLAGALRLENFQLILRKEPQHRFFIARAWPAKADWSAEGFSYQSALIRIFSERQRDYLASSFAYLIPGEPIDELAARREMEPFGAEICFPLSANDEPFGLLLLGPKANREPYTPQDLYLLSQLAKNLALTLNQIRLKERLLIQEEMELMGRMSRGLAHDLNNLVTPVSTYLQLIQEQEGRADGLEELLPVALRNIQTIRAYIKEALMFSNTQSLQLDRTTLDQVVRHATTLAHAKLQAKNIRVELDLLADVPVEIDSVLIQRVIDNLLSNAADASAVDSLIVVTLHQLARSEAQREWYRIEVIDQGEGISKENQKRIFTPYFTTKDKGDKTRGFGLGLAICRKIIHLHGGNLSVRSELGKGTTVQVDLPSAQLPQPAAKRQEVAA